MIGIPTGGATGPRDFWVPLCVSCGRLGRYASQWDAVVASRAHELEFPSHRVWRVIYVTLAVSGPGGSESQGNRPMEG